MSRSESGFSNSLVPDSAKMLDPEKLIAAKKETKKETQIDERDKIGEDEKWRLGEVLDKREDT